MKIFWSSESSFSHKRSKETVFKINFLYKISKKGQESLKWINVEFIGESVDLFISVKIGRPFTVSCMVQKIQGSAIN